MPKEKPFVPTVSTENLKAEAADYRRLVRKAERMLAHLPQNHLVAYKRKSGYQYYQYNPDVKSRTFLAVKKDHEQIQKLCQAEYLAKLRASCETRALAIEVLIKQISLSPLDLSSLMPNAKKASFVCPLLPSDEEYADSWQNAKYPHLTVPDGPHITSRGERVRSKSEVMIAEALSRANIPYRYEEELTLSDGRTVYPDFHILNPYTRKEYYWEHFGMMDDEEYVQKFLCKIHCYSRSGYVVGKNLLATFESQSEPLSLEDIRKTIEVLFD